MKCMLHSQFLPESTEVNLLKSTELSFTVSESSNYKPAVLRTSANVGAEVSNDQAIQYKPNLSLLLRSFQPIFIAYSRSFNTSLPSSIDCLSAFIHYSRIAQEKVYEKWGGSERPYLPQLKFSAVFEQNVALFFAKFHAYFGQFRRYISCSIANSSDSTAPFFSYELPEVLWELVEK